MDKIAPITVSFLLYHLEGIEQSYLQETIACYAQQVKQPTNLEIEIIVLLDGMKKDQLTIDITKLEKMAKIVFIEDSESFAGPGFMWNKGLEIAKSDFVVFTWTGITWYPDSLVYLYRWLEKEGADGAFGPMAYSYKSTLPYISNLTGVNQNLSTTLEEKNSVCLGYMLWKKTQVKKMGVFKEEKKNVRIADWEFLKKISRQLRLVRLPGKAAMSKMQLAFLPYPSNEVNALESQKFVTTLATHVKNTISVTFILYHYKDMTEDELIKTIESYAKQKPIPSFNWEIEIIVMLDGIKLSQLPIVEQLAQRKISHLSIIENEKRFTGPGKLWNEGVKKAKGDYIAFTWTGAIWYPDSALHFIRLILNKKVDAVYGPVIYDNPDKHNSHVPKEVGTGLIVKDLIAFSNMIPLCYTMVTKQAFDALGGFKEEEIYGQIADWEFMKRLVNRFEIQMLLGKPIHVKQPLSVIGYTHSFPYTIDTLIRHQFYIKKNNNKKISRKIAIISGVTENAQVQLSLINYFERINVISDNETFTWRRFLESEIKPEELEPYDIVFFVRCRKQGAVSSAKYCLKHQIKTVYLLDDNWFCATDTYPQLKAQIGKNTATYLFFTLLLSMVDYVLVNNDVILEDVKKYNPQVIKIKTNINLEHFQAEIEKEDDMVHIGFAGSSSKVQHFGEAFKALERIMEEFENVKLYFKGIQLPTNFQKYGERIIQEGYTFDYKEYAKMVSNWHYDIMLSPLDNTRYINSKCPNKYLEITAAGAVGIYSDIPIYQEVITPFENGLLVQNKEEGWHEALVTLIKNEFLRKSMYLNAEKDIKENYDTKVVVKEFIEFLNKTGTFALKEEGR